MQIADEQSLPLKVRGDLIVDVDRHVQETWSIFEDYADPQFKDRVFKRVKLPDGLEGIAVDNHLMPGWSTAMWTDPGANKFFEDERFWPNNPEIREHDVNSYLGDMNTEGIDVAIVIPTIALGVGSIPNGQVGSAMCRAYTRWVSEFCSSAPDRLIPVAPINMFDVEQAVADAKWAVEKMNLRGLFISAIPVNGRGLDHPDFSAFWAMAQEMDVPVQVHSISSLPDSQGRGPLVEVMAGVNRFGGNIFFHHLVSHRIEQHLAMANIVAGGVLEKFPKLQVVFTESGGGWVASWLEDMDSHYHSHMQKWVPWLKMAPSEYFSRQCLIAFDADEATLGVTAPLIGVGNVAWFSDYPHYDCVFPGAVNMVRKNMATLSDEEQSRILGINAAQFYGLDTKSLIARGARKEKMF